MGNFSSLIRFLTREKSKKIGGNKMSITELLEKLEKIYDFDEENPLEDEEPDEITKIPITELFKEVINDELDNDKKTSYLN